MAREWLEAIVSREKGGDILRLGSKPQTMNDMRSQSSLTEETLTEKV